MLFTEVQEKTTDFVYPDGYKADDSLRILRNKLSVAALYVMDEQACAMAANVSLTKPSSILASLPFVQLPAEATWIEFDNFHVRRATSALGSPNIRADNAVAEILRSGFLMYMDVDERRGKKDLVIEYVHKDRPFSGRLPDGRDTLVDIAPVVGRFSLAQTDDFRPADFPSIPRDPSIPAAGKVRQHLDLISKNPEEAAAWLELHARFTWEPHPDLRRLAASVTRLMGPAAVAQVEENQAGDLSRVFLNQVLPSLILLNCRNAVERQVTPAPERLNKQRLKKGRAPIREYTTLKIHLSGSQKRAMEREGVSYSGARDGSFVMGHFKVRKTGIFYWGFHMRGGGPKEGPRRVRVLTA